MLVSYETNAGHHGAGRQKDKALADLGVSLRSSIWASSVSVTFKHLSSFINSSKKIILEHHCLTGLGEEKGSPFGFVLFVQQTGQKQEGVWAERLESTLDRSHRTMSQQLGEVDRAYVILGIATNLKKKKKDKIWGKKKGTNRNSN